MVLDLSDADGAIELNLERVRSALSRWPGVAQVSVPLVNQRGATAILSVVPKTSPQDSATKALVHSLRQEALPPLRAETGFRAYVTGPTAASIDIADRIGSRMPFFFAVVIGLSFLLLTLLFRSVLVPLKAAVVNLLSIGAAYGVLVAVFQWGWLAGLIGTKPGPIESFLPTLLFALLFGLSMDYEVFLISRIREAWVATHDSGESVAYGLAVTARVITASASVMVAVFFSFVLGGDRLVKEAGLGLATAILVDATVVRLILVPSTMQLLGDANWWLPRSLERWLPRVSLEAQPAPTISQPSLKS